MRVDRPCVDILSYASAQMNSARGVDPQRPYAISAATHESCMPCGANCRNTEAIRFPALCRRNYPPRRSKHQKRLEVEGIRLHLVS